LAAEHADGSRRFCRRNFGNEGDRSDPEERFSSKRTRKGLEYVEQAHFGSRIISAREILRGQTVQCQDVDLDDNGVLILDLDNALTVTRGAR